MDKDLGKNREQGSNTEAGKDGHRLTINRAAEAVLVRAVERINDGYDGGRVNRNQVAIWAVQRFGERLDDEEIREIRSEYLDEFSAIDAVLRRAKETGKLPPELKAFLQKQMGLDDAPKKKSKKSLPDVVINDDMAS